MGSVKIEIYYYLTSKEKMGMEPLFVFFENEEYMTPDS